MPFSFGTYDRVASAIFRLINPKKILDVGCGAGKYGAMAKTIIPGAKRVGIEIEEKYVDKFYLRTLYDEVRVGDAQAVLRNNIGENFDLVIFGDSIEHMPKSVGLDLLNYLTYRSQYILIFAPEFIIQHEVDGVAEEAHVSVWSEHDFAWHDRWAWENCWTMSLFLLRGYLQSDITLHSLVDAINGGDIPLTAENTNRPIRNIRLNLMIRDRHNLNEAGQQVVFRPF